MLSSFCLSHKLIRLVLLDAKIMQQEDIYGLTMQTLQETLILNWVNERTGAKVSCQ